MPYAVTPVLEIAYEVRGPRHGPPVILVHGFPDSIRTWDRVAEALAADGMRVFVPSVRGFGETKLRDAWHTTGETAALGRDILEFADAVGVERFALVGHDWGARAAYVAAALEPHRIASMVVISVGYGTNLADQRLSPEQSRAYWYQWYFGTERGVESLENDRDAFCESLWRLWSPSWAFTVEEYGRTAAAFDNPEFVKIVIHSYRQRWGFVPGHTRYELDRSYLDGLPPLDVATLVLHGDEDGATLPEMTQHKEAFFRGPYRRETFSGCGHFVQRERPLETIGAIREWFARHASFATSPRLRST